MSTVVGLLHLKLNIAQADSLKDKRRIVKGFKDRVRHGHNVSIAEVEMLDAHRWSVLAVAMVGNDRRYLDGALAQIINLIRGNPVAELIDYELEIF